jgi:hypothetical protein
MVPTNASSITKRILRFLSNDPTEAESPSSPQILGNINIIGNYTSPELFYIKPPPGLIYELHRVLIRIYDTNVINSWEYISGATLTNGINICYIANGIEVPVTPFPIKTIGDWASYAGVDVRPLDTANQTRNWAIRWTFTKSGKPIYLWGSKDESICAKANDDFTSLVTHTAVVQGIWHNESAYL